MQFIFVLHHTQHDQDDYSVLYNNPMNNFMRLKFKIYDLVTATKEITTRALIDWPKYQLQIF